jgi:peptidoglycan lytic transglycosylase B
MLMQLKNKYKAKYNINFSIRLAFAVCLSIILSSVSISFSSGSADQSAKIDTFRPVLEALNHEGVDTNTAINLLINTKAQFNEKYVKFNVTGYLKKANYSSHYNDRSVKKSKSFLDDNVDLLQAAEDRFGVPKEVITSVLWVETRHGGYLGNHHIPTVFFSTAMSDQEENVEKNLTVLREFPGADTLNVDSLVIVIRARAAKKSKWALGELVALCTIYEANPDLVKNLKGSWAGAFGMSQFLPTSYLNWAVDGNDDGEIDLFDKEDAVHSVANYLKTNGWGDDEESQKKAVYHYNNSTAYVNAILTLADKITIKPESETLESELNSLDKMLEKN